MTYMDAWHAAQKSAVSTGQQAAVITRDGKTYTFATGSKIDAAMHEGWSICECIDP